ncbi:MAG: hypothetical protein K6F00_11160 [Lachnospiraceae bacterium]|nr:hypothetical protein [Lachnospiraceae bacterium]
MNKPNLNIMDIYPEMLQDSYGLCESILMDYGYTEQDFFELFNQDLNELELSNLSNRIVSIMFSITADLIKQKNPKVNVDYYVNGTLDTHFIIDGEEQ